MSAASCGTLPSCWLNTSIYYPETTDSDETGSLVKKYSNLAQDLAASEWPPRVSGINFISTLLSIFIQSNNIQLFQSRSGFNGPSERPASVEQKHRNERRALERLWRVCESGGIIMEQGSDDRFQTGYRSSGGLCLLHGGKGSKLSIDMEF